MKEEWLLNGAVVPVDVETTSALVAEIKRLINVVGGMALQQAEIVQRAEEAYEAAKEREWQGLTDSEREQFRQWAHPDIIEAIELRLQERNT